MTHSLNSLSRRLARKLLSAESARHVRLGVEPLERRDNPNGTLSGVAFQDFNANGAIDTAQPITNAGGGTVQGAIDRGIAGVVVTAYDAANTPRGSAVTSATGAYSLAATGVGPYRVEFTALPEGLSAGPRGADSKTTVQFVPDGDSINVSVGLTRPADYARLNPLLATSRYVYGDQVNGANKGQSTIVAFPYSSGGDTGNYTTNPPTRLATAAQVGTTFGLSYNPTSGDLFAAAYFKRHAGFGPGGTGAIYRIANAASATPGTPAVYADLNALFGANTAGPNQHDTANYDRDNDNTGWQAVGTTGLGGSDISDDGKFLFVMNLYDRQLYRVPTSGAVTNATVAHAPISLLNPDSSLTGGVINPARFQSDDLRPFAVQYYRGKVYVGVTYTAQTLATGPDDVTARNELLAAVYEVDPNTLTFGSQPILKARLNYERSQSSIGFADNKATVNPWRPWSSTFFTTATDKTKAFGVAPQAMLSDISFDAFGNVNLGLRDRGADQIGYYAQSDPSRPTVRIEGFTTGDTLRAFINQTGNLAGGWTLEKNARGPAGQGAGPQANASGPGGGEFYYQDNFGTSHGETSMGSQLQLAGRPDVVSLQMDPGSDSRAGGVRVCLDSCWCFSGVFVCRLFCPRCQAVEHHLDRTGVDRTLAHAVVTLVVLAVRPAPPDPRERPLHHPPPGQDHPTLGARRPTHDRQPPPDPARQSGVQLVAVVAPVRPHQSQARELTRRQRPAQLLRSARVTRRRPGHDRGQQKPQRVRGNVPFLGLPGAFAGLVEAPVAADLGGLDGLAVDAAGAWGRVASLGQAHRLAQGVVHPPPGPALGPRVPVVVHRLVDPVLLGQHPPLATRPVAVEDAVEDHTHIDRAGAALVRPRDQRFQDGPLLVGQVGRIDWLHEPILPQST